MSKTTPQSRGASAGGADGAARAEQATKDYLVGDCPIDHDGERYEPGSEISLTAAQAKRLGKLVAVKA